METTTAVTKEPGYLLNRQEAAERYNISVRQLDHIYKLYPDFPIIRNGKRVLIHRPRADEWFDSWVGGEITVR